MGVSSAEARGSARRALQLTEINLIEMQRHLKFDIGELVGRIYMLHILYIYIHECFQVVRALNPD